MKLWATLRTSWLVLVVPVFGLVQPWIRGAKRVYSPQVLGVPSSSSSSSSSPVLGEGMATKEVTLATAEDRIAYAKKAKERVLRMIPTLSDERDGHERLGLLLDSLTKVHAFNPIMTSAFLELALSGTWHLVYTTAALGGGGTRMRLVNITQTITPASSLERHNTSRENSEEEGERRVGPVLGGDRVKRHLGRLSTVLAWSFAASAAGQQGVLLGPESKETNLLVSHGTFSVTASYLVNSKGDLELTFDDDDDDEGDDDEGGGSGGCGYELTPFASVVANSDVVTASQTPPQSSPASSSSTTAQLADPKALCTLLERACPNDLFQPHGVTLKTTYMDESFRVVEASGGSSLQGGRVRAVFVRA